MLWKFKPAYLVQLGGENIGLIDNKEKVQKEVEDAVERPQAPVASAHLKKEPEYSLKLVAKKDIDVDDKKVFETIDENIEKTYKFYDVRIKDKVIARLITKEEADRLVNEIKEERDYAALEITEEITKENMQKPYEESKKLAMVEIEQVQTAERTVAEGKRKVAEKTRFKAITSSGRSIASSVSSNAREQLQGMKFLNPSTNSRIMERFMGAGGYSGHTGIDLASPVGAPTRAAASGTVVAVRDLGRRSYGKYIVVDHGNGVSTLYAHNSQLLVSVGQTVSQGQTIARSGQTGRATGPHIHFEIKVNGRAINPERYIR